MRKNYAKLSGRCVPGALLVFMAALCIVPTAHGKGQKEARRIILAANLAGVDASSELTDPISSPFTFSKWNAVDGRKERAWVPDEQNNGVGEWLQIRFLAPVEVQAVGINGACLMLGEEKALLYHRIKKVSIETDDGDPVAGALEDRPERQIVHMGGRVTSRLKIVIRNFYPGLGRPMACISEVRVYGRNVTEGAVLTRDMAPLLANDIDLAFREGLRVRPASLAGPRLKRSLSDLLVKYKDFDRLEVIARILAYNMKPLISPEDGDEPCRESLKAAYELAPLARRYVRERYFLEKDLPLLGACPGLSLDQAAYPLLAGRAESIPLFWKRGEYYGLLELGDTRAAGPFLESFASRAPGDRWWESPAGVHSKFDRSPLELLTLSRDPSVRRTVEELAKKSRAGTHYGNGLRRLLSRLP